MQQLLASLNPIRDLSGNFYVADFFDVIIIALFIYAAMILFKQTRSFSILAGIGIIVVLYVVAQAFNLYLTTLTLRSFFGVSLLILVILFQEELRRFFELIAIGQRNQARGYSSPILTELMLAVTGLARKKVGALIVLTGSEKIDRHIKGGQELNGIISEELLESLLDPKTPGHDGAIVIAKNRIKLFSAHLPLSNNFKQIGKHGTRHSAALGISELSDSLAIVVSEEHGTISVARGGKLATLKNTGDLEPILNKFQAEKFPPRTGIWKKFIRRNSLEKIGAISLAVVLWFFTAFQAETIQQEFTVPVTYRNLPAGLTIAQSKPRDVTVTLRSRGNAFKGINNNDIGISIDVSDLDSGKNRVQIFDEMIIRPFNFSVVAVEPPEIELTLEQFVTRSVPIDAEIIGVPDKRFTVDTIIITPNELTFVVPKTFDKKARIKTNPIDISGISLRSTFNATLALPEGVRIPAQGDPNILVTVILRQK